MYPNQLYESQIKLKRQSYHKEIRNKFKNQYFSTQRKLLYLKQLSERKESNNSIKHNNSSNNLNIKWLEQKLNCTFVVNYLEVNQYLESKQSEKITLELQDKIAEVMMRPESLKNQEAMIMFTNLLKRQEFAKQILTQDRVLFFVENLIQKNIVMAKANQQQNHVYGINYFDTVCWLIFSLAVTTKQTSLFSALKNYYPYLQSQSKMQQPASTTSKINLCYISLITQLSTYSQLLPSKCYILYLLSINSSYSQNKPLIILLTRLIDNYLRYFINLHPNNRFITQQILLPQQSDNNHLIYLYIKFIRTHIKQFTLPAYLKVQLTYLFTTLIKALAPNLLKQKIFSYKESEELIQEIYYRANYGDYNGKVASLICFFEILANSEIHNQILVIIPAESIVESVYNSIDLSDELLRNYIVAVVFNCMIINKKVYANLFQAKGLWGKINVMANRNIKIENYGNQQRYNNGQIVSDDGNQVVFIDKMLDIREYFTLEE